MQMLSDHCIIRLTLNTLHLNNLFRAYYLYYVKYYVKYYVNYFYHFYNNGNSAFVAICSPAIYYFEKYAINKVPIIDIEFMFRLLCWMGQSGWGNVKVYCSNAYKSTHFVHMLCCVFIILFIFKAWVNSDTEGYYQIYVWYK